MFDMKNDMSFVRMGGATLSGTTPSNTSLVDMQGWSALTVLLMTGTVTDAGAAAGFTLKLQHSDTTAAADFVDCAANELSGSNPAVTADGDDNVVAGSIGYVGKKRYVRAVVTGTTGTDAAYIALGVLGHATQRSLPVATAIITATAAT